MGRKFAGKNRKLIFIIYKNIYWTQYHQWSTTSLQKWKWKLYKCGQEMKLIMAIIILLLIHRVQMVQCLMLGINFNRIASLNLKILLQYIIIILHQVLWPMTAFNNRFYPFIKVAVGLFQPLMVAKIKIIVQFIVSDKFKT